MGAPVIAVVIGVLVAALLRRFAPSALTRSSPGVRFSSKFVLQLSVVILGTQLSIVDVVRVGFASLPVMLGTLAVCFTAAWLVGRALGVVGNLRTLIGVGTGICGASAIAAVTPVIGAVGVEVTYAISTIFLCNVVAVLAFPLVGHLLGLSQHSFGVFAGTAVNDTSSVVAAANTYGQAATETAVVVKLVRTLMIIPVTVTLAALAGRVSARVTPEQLSTDAVDTTTRRRPSLRVHRLVPWFLVGFLLVVLARSIGLIPFAATPSLAATASFMITIALAGVGLATDIGAILRAGLRPLLLGIILWVVVALSSLGIQVITGGI